VIFVIEFKVGERHIKTKDYNQVWDYALDLKNFHRASHLASIIPILVATETTAGCGALREPAPDGVYPPMTCNGVGLSSAIHEGLITVSNPPLDGMAWSQAAYQPTPTIIEAAQALYSNHSVEAIAASEAGENLTWRAYISPHLTDSEYDAEHALEHLGTRAQVVAEESLHLAVSMRSFRAEHVSRFIKAVLDLDEATAKTLLHQTLPRYPIALTRNLERAKEWIRSHARGSERYGLVASSGAQRLKPHAVDIRVNVDPVHWFLSERDDTRSSFYLEDAATEFQVQGLELDWACVLWDADFRFASDHWTGHEFRSSVWQNIRKEDRHAYLRNAYRVLLTRARQGMVICIPPGHSTDATRRPEYYDRTFEYLSGLGVPVI